ncbi:LysE family translocator [Paenibacillus sp. BR2-3]|uniref:LysE family translocator n=1 Tax=Paenibacillus sp. BR2-3 TaxID=3048494 RepID=UPI003977580F
MFGIEHYFLFLVSGVILNMTPGTDTFYILGRTIAQGRSTGLLSVFGIISGTFAHTVFAALGLSVILAQSALAFSVVKWLGAGYLLYLGIRSLLSKESEMGTDGGTSAVAKKKIYLNGFLTNLLNPKVALFYLAFMPQFISPGNSYGTLPFLLLGITFIATSTLWCCLLVLFSDMTTRRLRQNSRISVVLNRIAGILFIALGVKVFFSSRAGS